MEEWNGVYLAFVPVDTGSLLDSPLDVWVLNNTARRLRFALSLDKKNTAQQAASGPLEAGQKTSIKKIGRAGIEEWCIFGIDMEFESGEPLNEHLKLNPTAFYKTGSYIENPFFPVKALFVPLYEQAEQDYKTGKLSKEHINELLTHKEFHPAKNISKRHQHQKGLSREVDLHIGSIVDFPGKMTAAEKLNRQVAHFRTELDRAMADSLKSIVFIHGVGEGVLKHEIRRMLDMEGLHYQDGSYARYGFGATEVFFR